MQVNSSHRWKTEHLLLRDLTCTVEYHPSWSLSESPWNHPDWTLSSLDLPPTQGAGLVTSHDDMRFFRRPGDPENYCKPSFATIRHSVKKEQSAAKGENATGILGAGGRSNWCLSFFLCSSWLPWQFCGGAIQHRVALMERCFFQFWGVVSSGLKMEEPTENIRCDFPLSGALFFLDDFSMLDVLPPSKSLLKTSLFFLSHHVRPGTRDSEAAWKLSKSQGFQSASAGFQKRYTLENWTSIRFWTILSEDTSSKRCFSIVTLVFGGWIYYS